MTAYHEHYHTDEICAILNQEFPGLIGLGAFGSRIRAGGVHFPSSDLELLALLEVAPACQKPYSTTELRIRLAQIAGVPSVDLKLVPKDTFMKPMYDPKQFSMALEIQFFYGASDIPTADPRTLYDPRDFITFLEYERLRNIDIFSPREADAHFLKKMPGGRRSFDEIYWLSMITGQVSTQELPLALQTHLYDLRQGVGGEDMRHRILAAQPALDARALQLERVVCPELEQRGQHAVSLLSPRIYESFASNDPERLARIYSDAASLGTPHDWITVYALSFNKALPLETAMMIATGKDTGRSEHSFRKLLLQNRAAGTPRFREVVATLKNDPHQLVRMYACVRDNPSYLSGIAPSDREFYTHMTSHIRA